jgi:type I restriction enzyme S subunit
LRESGVEWLGQVPDHWETRPLITTVTAVQNGTWGDEPTGTPADVACVRVADFDRLRLTVQDRELTQRSVAPAEVARHRLRPGDLLLEKSGGGDVQPVGKVVLFDLPVDSVCSNFVARLRVRSDHHPRYCAYLHDVLYRARVNLRSIKQSTGIQNLDSGTYLREVVALPPVVEQRSIADYLDRATGELDRLVTSIRLQIERLQERRSTLITSMMIGQAGAAHQRSDEA